MKAMATILPLLVALTISQTGVPVIGTWNQFSEPEFYYDLKLDEDGMFKWTNSFSLGTTTSTGKWEIARDTIYLFDYEKPWKISEVRELHIDSLQSTQVEVRYFDHLSRSRPLSDYYFTINDRCDLEFQTDSLGRVKISEFLKGINFKYDSYTIKDSTANLIVVEMNRLPVWLSPPTLTWTRWTFENNLLKPLECGKLVEFIELRKKVKN